MRTSTGHTMYLGYPAHAQHNALNKIGGRKAQKREFATFDENQPAVGMLNSVRDTNEGKYRGGRRDATCDRGLSGRRPLRIKPLTS